jgi:hypothetical protein
MKDKGVVEIRLGLHKFVFENCLAIDFWQRDFENGKSSLDKVKNTLLAFTSVIYSLSFFIVRGPKL